MFIKPGEDFADTAFTVTCVGEISWPDGDEGRNSISAEFELFLGNKGDTLGSLRPATPFGTDVNAILTSVQPLFSEGMEAVTVPEGQDKGEGEGSDFISLLQIRNNRNPLSLLQVHLIICLSCSTSLMGRCTPRRMEMQNQPPPRRKSLCGLGHSRQGRVTRMTLCTP